MKLKWRPPEWSGESMTFWAKQLRSLLTGKYFCAHIPCLSGSYSIARHASACWSYFHQKLDTTENSHIILPERCVPGCIVHSSALRMWSEVQMHMLSLWFCFRTLLLYLQSAGTSATPALFEESKEGKGFWFWSCCWAWVGDQRFANQFRPN